MEEVFRVQERSPAMFSVAWPAEFLLKLTTMSLDCACLSHMPKMYRLDRIRNQYIRGTV